MKKVFFQFFTIILFSFFVINCSSTKNKTSVANVNAVAITKTEMPNVQLNKLEQKLIFPPTIAETKWVDSVYNQMTLEEKIGQLFMVAAYSNKDSVHFNAIDKLITNYKIGGVIFFSRRSFTPSKFDKSISKKI